MANVYFLPTSGNQDASVVGNYSTGALPGAGDTLWFDKGSAIINAGLTALSAIHLANVFVTPNFSGQFGDGVNGFFQWFTDYWQIGEPGQGGNTGLTRGMIDLLTNAQTGTVYGTGTAVDTGKETVRLKGVNAGNKLYVMGGSVGIGTNRQGDASTYSEVDIQGGVCNIGNGVTLTTLLQNGGQSITRCAMTTYTQTDGSMTTQGTGLIATAAVAGANAFNHRPAGNAFTSLTINSNGSADFTGDPRGVLIGTNPIDVYAGGGLYTFAPGQLQFATGPAAIQVRARNCRLEDIKLQMGRGVLLTVTAG